jgi:hypothetical protein
MPRGIAYVKEVLPNGWLSVVIRGIGEEDIPEGLKVNIYGERNGREYYRILEGVYKGKHASSPVKRNSSGVLIHSYFTTANRRIPSGANIIFRKKEKRLEIQGLGTFNAYTSQFNPIPNGVYDLEIPDMIHEGGARYTDSSRYAKTWFRIGRSGDRYLHCGSISAGCVTVTDTGRWTEIYRYLIYRRKSDTAVGTITVSN